ncbi:hypothetical protein ELI15_17220 [Rhizobium ruizarguesonis]|nr:hypothetical protein ELI15_17220 [Rhizobium ruizarguesonis]
MSVPFEPIVPPPSVPPLDNPPPDPDRIPGEEPLPDPQPDEGKRQPTGRLPIARLGECFARASAFSERIKDERQLER